MDELVGIETCVFGDSDGQLSESAGIAFDGQCFLSFNFLCELVTGKRHVNLRVSSTVNDLLVLDSLDQDAKSIMQGPLSLIKDVLTGSSEDNRAGFVSLAA